MPEQVLRYLLLEQTRSLSLIMAWISSGMRFQVKNSCLRDFSFVQNFYSNTVTTGLALMQFVVTRLHSSFFPPSISPLFSQREPCPRLIPPLPLLPTFNRLSMPLWRHMRRRRNSSFSRIPLPPSYSPATPPPPSYLSFKTLSSNLIAVAAAMRDYQIG